GEGGSRGGGKDGCGGRNSGKVRRKVTVGRRIKKSATSAASIASALSHPNSRSDGRSENTVTARPHASTIEVTTSGGPICTVARSPPAFGSSCGVSSKRRPLRKGMGALQPSPKATHHAHARA